MAWDKSLSWDRRNIRDATWVSIRATTGRGVMLLAGDIQMQRQTDVCVSEQVLVNMLRQVRAHLPAVSHP